MPGSVFFHQFACISGAAGVIAGAFGSHALKQHLTPYQQSSWQTATYYQLIHSAALLFIANQPSSRALQISSNCFAIGITLFSGSIYGLCLTKEGDKIRSLLGPATPLGGMAFIAGWIALALARRGGVRLG